MQTLGTICAVTLAGAAQAGGDIAVPSGQAVQFVERIDNGDIVHFRFLAPRIAREGGTVDAEAADADMQALCDGFALPALKGAPMPARIVIALSDRKTEFGVPTPEATQLFAPFRVEAGACIWEPF